MMNTMHMHQDLREAAEREYSAAQAELSSLAANASPPAWSGRWSASRPLATLSPWRPERRYQPGSSLALPWTVTDSQETTMPQLTPGQAAPDFTLADATGTPVHLADLLRNHREGCVVYFYPRASTPGCTKEACDFRDSLAAWEQAGYGVVGVSPDSQAAIARFAATQSLPFPCSPTLTTRSWRPGARGARRRATAAH